MDLTLSDKHKRAIKEVHGPQPKADCSSIDYNALFEAHWERLCRVLTRLTGDPDEAQDLVLEAFLRLHHKPPADRRNLGGWLYRTATNLGLNALRAGKRRRRYEEQAGALALEHSQPLNPAAVLERRQERQQVRRALGDMKPRSAQILVLRHSGLSYAEIAEALGVSPGSVGTLLARAEREFEKKYALGNRI